MGPLANHQRSNLLAPLLALALTAGACTSDNVECRWDTDCAREAYVCDLATHRCVPFSIIIDGPTICQDDLDCDPVLERCSNGRCVRIGGDLDPGGDGDRPDNPVCWNPDLDCSQQGLPGQGRDRDFDLWGECCDCDDADQQVHPGRAEIAYNGKDDDCDPASPDSDLDGDGFDAVAAGGQDCDDHNPRVHPGAEEGCDGIDTDCDGAIDPPGCLVTQPPPMCPDLSGAYTVFEYCLMHEIEDPAIFVQDGCEVTFDLDPALHCSGTIDAAMNLHFKCPGLGVPCGGKAKLDGPFRTTCSVQCSFLFIPLEVRDACTHHFQPDCLQADRLCGVVGVDGAPDTVCIGTNPAGRGPGFFCDPDQDRFCVNSLCLDHACGAICEDDAQCVPFEGTACQTVVYDDGVGTYGEIEACVPTVAGATRCRRSPDCAPNRTCTFRRTADAVETICATSGPQAGRPGQACAGDDDCASGLCLCKQAGCAGGAKACAEPCASEADCNHTAHCQSVGILDLSGEAHTLQACTPDPQACGRNADCPEGLACQVFAALDGSTLQTRCSPGAGPGGDNTGQTCADPADCFSAWCDADRGTCAGVCLADSDCPSDQDDTQVCAGDADCTLEDLCVAGVCRRAFECAAEPLRLGTDGQGLPAWDTVGLCRRVRRPCALDDDCRSGEACQVQLDPTATSAAFACQPGQGPGQLGDDCTEGGAGACWTGLCLETDEDGAGQKYCSRACTATEDCGPIAEWACWATRVDIRPGYARYLPVCVRL